MANGAWDGHHLPGSAAPSPAREKIGHGSYVEPKTIKFAQFAEEWLESRVAVRVSTLSSYGSIVRRRLIPHFGKMSLSEIGYDQVQNFVTELAKEVSVKTLHNVIICLRVMLAGSFGRVAAHAGLEYPIS
jgi:hypothetical protein